MSKFKAFTDDKIIQTQKKIEICVGKSRKHCGKKRKCWLPACSPFPTMVSKAFFPRGVKSRDGVVKGKLMSFSIDDLTFSDEVCHICHQGVHKDEPECKAADQLGGDAL